MAEILQTGNGQKLFACRLENGRTVYFYVVGSRRRSGFSIRPKGQYYQVNISSANPPTLTDIKKWMRQNPGWFEKVEAFNSTQTSLLQTQIDRFEKEGLVPLYGEFLPYRMVREGPSELKDGVLLLNPHDAYIPKKIYNLPPENRALLSWYSRSFAVEIDEWGKRLLKHNSLGKWPSVSFEPLNSISKWGDCNRTIGRIRLNFVLKFLPKHVVEAVIFHEITHLAVLGHNTRFYALLDSLCPWHREADAELKKIDLKQHFYHYLYNPEQIKNSL